LADRQLPTELWIKIFRHIADLERYPPGVSYPLLPSTQPLAYDTPTIRTLCFTSKYFYDIALPLCYEETSVYYTDTYISGPYRSEPVSHEWVFFDPQTAPLVRTLRWCTFTPAEELARALSSTTNLRYLTMTQNYFSVKLGDLVGIPCLYNVTYLELCGPSYTIDSSNTNFEMFNLRTLALRKPTVDTTEYTLIDNLYRFPRLSELILLAPTADQILYRLISNGSPPLILESLTVLQDMRPTGPLDTQHHLYRYLQERCSDLRTLDIPRLWREPPKLLWKHLPSLRTFCGPTAVAASCISPTSAIEELQLTFSFDYPQWAKSPREELEMISVSPDRLQHLEMSVDAASPDLLEYILDRFPALTSLGFINVKGPPSGPQHVSSLHPILCYNTNTDFCSGITVVLHPIPEFLHPIARQLDCLRHNSVATKPELPP
jgi:hypothetical protein